MAIIGIRKNMNMVNDYKIFAKVKQDLKKDLNFCHKDSKKLKSKENKKN